MPSKLLPLTPAVTLAEFKLFARIDHTGDDLLIPSLIQAATTEAGNRCHTSFALDSYRLTLDTFPADDAAIELTGDPGVVNSITYTDAMGDPATLTAYTVTEEWTLEPETSWPAGTAVVVEYTPGEQPDVPEAVKTWIKVRATSLYQQRQTVEAGRPIAEVNMRFADALLDAYVPVGRLF